MRGWAFWGPAIGLLAVVGGLLTWMPEAIMRLTLQSYLPHGFCFLWDPRLLGLHTVSDAVIFVSYLAISLTLTWLLFRERQRIPFVWVFAAFGLFIVACGFTHLMDIVVLWIPLYWLQGDVKLVTALASLTTAVSLPFYIPRITELLDQARKSRLNERRFLTASHNSSDAFYILESVRDAQGEIFDFRFTFANAKGGRLVSQTPAELVGKLLCEELPINRTGGFFELYRKVVETGESLEQEFSINDRLIDAEWLNVQVVPLEDGIALTTTNITSRKHAEMKLEMMAHHDALTGLPTRTLLHDRLATALARAGRRGTNVALLMIDIDRFKKVNDLYGHHAGDKLLVEIGRRLREVVRKTDTVARMGGDEFVVLLEDLETLADAEEIAQHLLTCVEVPVDLGSHTHHVTASVGICLYPDGGETAEALLLNADAAMYRVKSEGRNGLHRFTRDMASVSTRKRDLESGLSKALARNEFQLVWQPQISLRTGRVSGVEALLRWRSDRLGMVMPTEFIPVAEESGLIVPIGEWVLRTACQAGVELERALGRSLVIGVNVSPRQFHQDGLARIVEEALAESGLRSSSLELEITENVLVSDSSRTMAELERVRALGIRLAIDDFGTGFSSMSYILRFHVDRLKIDRSFICNMTVDSDSRAVTTAVNALANGLHINVVAEGVETASHRDLLRAMDCDEAQGYFYSKPVEMERLIDVIREIEEKAAGDEMAVVDEGAAVSERVQVT